MDAVHMCPCFVKLILVIFLIQLTVAKPIKLDTDDINGLQFDSVKYAEEKALLADQVSDQDGGDPVDPVDHLKHSRNSTVSVEKANDHDDTKQNETAPEEKMVPDVWQEYLRGPFVVIVIIVLVSLVLFTLYIFKYKSLRRGQAVPTHGE
ncbi:hypothetical protein HDE_08177 [Halotydeus destructor]|nr:hypothetical protein HDE_08177 [Halotydeus destructor]